jgi:hypothetical protein
VQVLVIVILVPSLAVSVGLVLLSVALMRYLRYLKRSHDAIHLTEAWKRRNPPGLISDGNDRVLREVSWDVCVCVGGGGVGGGGGGGGAGGVAGFC